MKMYNLIRDVDISGVSGTGLVAEVCQFDNGWCAVGFTGESTGVSNLIVYSDLAHVEKIHGQLRSVCSSR